MKKLRFILGDQLNYKHYWLEDVDDSTLYFMAETLEETGYVNHHIQKIIGFFMAMRSFAEHLKAKGFNVVYYKIDDSENQQNLEENLNQIIEKHNIEKFEYQLPDEYRLDKELSELEISGVKIESVDTDHFLTERLFLKKFFEGKKTYLMERFYRHMRKKYDIMMVNGEPEGGDWNYDEANRKKLPKSHIPPEPLEFEHDYSSLEKLLKSEGVRTIGNVDSKNFPWPTNRDESLEVLEYFCKNLLPLFGTYQDAMSTNSWSNYHARVSFALNTKQLSPLEVVQRVIEEWRERPEEIEIQQVEGFVRQIIGWREFMRGVYWAHMPEYKEKNFFDHHRELPEFYWNGKTKMNCLRQAIGQSLNHAYAHHIQRLMVTGNFALLAGIDPDQVDDWYLGIYIDAIEWVEITNTRGMSQFADGGIVGTKPYVSSASYIDKMSDYCKDCYYSKSKKTGAKACPFNSLYWHFMERNRVVLKNNFRMGMMYSTLDRMKNKEDILEQAENYLDKLNEL